jgi:hypothetical protein
VVEHEQEWDPGGRERNPSEHNTEKSKGQKGMDGNEAK